MQSDIMHSADPTSRPRGLLVAVTISIAVHGLFGLLLCTRTAIRSQSADDKPLNEIAVVVVPDEPANLVLSADSSPSSISGAIPGVPADQDSGPIRVAPLPVDADSGNPDTDVPRVVNPPTLAGTGSNSSSTGTAFFGVQVPARSVVFVIDRSMSMWFNHGLEAAKRELLEKLDRLSPGTRFQVFFYDNKLEFFPSTERDGLLANLEENRLQIIRLVKSINGRGSTDHMTALRQALRLRPEAILFISDAEDLRGEQVRSITAVNQGRTAIHAVQWSPTHEESQVLRDLAHRNRGSYQRLGP